MHKWAIALLAFAGIMGAAGVAGGAAAAHVTGGGSLQTAANYALFHAAALAAIGLAAGSYRGFLAAGTLMALGVTLFSGDIALRTLTSVQLFPMAAPTGGMLLIAGWLLLAGTATVNFGKGDHQN